MNYYSREITQLHSGEFRIDSDLNLSRTLNYVGILVPSGNPCRSYFNHEGWSLKEDLTINKFKDLSEVQKWEF